MQAEFGKLPVNGKQTTGACKRRIRKIISDSQFRVARECNVLVSYLKVHIEGKKVVLGEASVMLPNGSVVSVDELRRRESGK